jgi:hypothetical protein
MRPATFCLGFLLIYSGHLFAQNDKWTVKAGEEVNEALTPDVKFRYPQFIPGNVYYKDGTNSGAPLDLNLLNEEMQFINSNGDTLSIDNESTIKFITISNDTFFYAKKFLELVSGNLLIKLAVKQRLKLGDTKKIGGYDQATSTSAITNVSSLNDGTRVTKLNQRVELLLVKETTYFIGDNYNNFLPANKRNVIKMFPRQETAILDFLKENRVRFYNEDDLKMLINFLQKIQ